MSWIKLIEQLAPVILGATPLGPITPFVVLGINSAEAMHGATSDDKLTHAVEIAKLSVGAVNQQAGKILVDPVLSDDALKHGISTVVDVVNIVHKSHEKLVS